MKILAVNAIGMEGGTLLVGEECKGITFYHSYRCDIWDTQRRNKYNDYLLN